MNSTDHSPAGRRGPAATPDRAVVYSAAHVSGILLALAGMASLWAFLHSITFLDSMVTLPAAGISFLSIVKPRWERKC